MRLTFRFKSLGDRYFRDGRSLQAKSTVALGAVEMDMEVVVIVLVVAVAEFIADPFAHILQRVDEMHFPEQLQGAENVGFINRVKTRGQSGAGLPSLLRRAAP